MNKIPPKERRQKYFSKEELLKLDKNQLVEKILKLEAHNFQLKNIISKTVTEDSKDGSFSRKKPFDFSKCHFRKVLLRIMYFGWDYRGFVVQEDTNQTVEGYLFNALTKLCLIESREMSQYHRCGRTDKGVSSFGQVISILLRSKYAEDEQNTTESIKNEIQYCKLLNRLLPMYIRAVAWMPTPEGRPDYSARFDCKQRQYKYYFPKSALDINAMRVASKHLLGSNDYRHLCKMDVGNGVTEFVRKISKADIFAMDETDTDKPTSMYYLLLEGNAFLWHQIRCIMGVLLLVGEGKEEPDIIKDLLDVEKYPRKPQYNLALDIPLNLFHCTYDGEDRWVYDKEELRIVISQLQGEWTTRNVKSTMILHCLKQLEEQYMKLCQSETSDTNAPMNDKDKVMSYTDCLLQGVKSKTYTPLLKRKTCSSLEERVEYYKKRGKIEDHNHQNVE